MLHLIVHRRENKILVQHESLSTSLQLSRRWSGHVLALLVTHHRSGETLSAPVLQLELQRQGQPQPLNRTQIHRIVLDLNSTLSTLPQATVALQFSPGKHCSGPWRLQFPAGVTWHVDDDEHRASSQPPSTRQAWSSPLLCADSHMPSLLELVQTLMVSDDLYRHGSFQEAHEVLQKAYTAHLTPEARQLVSLRDAYALKQYGDFQGARDACISVLNIGRQGSKDAAISSQANFTLDRISYDEKPGTAYTTLRATATLPPAIYAPNPTTLGEWHNLQALLARRHMLAAPAQAAESHQLALLHYESALYLLLATRDMVRISDVLFNMAFHLQKTLLFGLSSLIEVCQWYAMALHYDYRHNLAGSAAWDYIYLADLWQSHYADLTLLMRQGAEAREQLTSALVLGQNHPWQTGFYQAAIQHAQQTGDPRQQAIIRIMASRFILINHGCGLSLKAQQRDLSTLLDSTPDLRTQLIDDGYIDLDDILARQSH
jgi:hypothetical protein